MTDTKRKLLVTNALPYANGPIHLGHLIEHIQSDIWARFQKLRGHECHYVCADDTHGTPTMLKARSEGITPEELVERYHEQHVSDLAGFLVHYDNYYTTHSPENRELAETIYLRLRDGGHMTSRTIEQLYDPVKQMFLPDRFIKGECPRCGAADQYGDACESCGATYTPAELKNPVSVLSGTTPESRESEHYFFKLPDFEAMLRDWTRAGHLQTEVANKLDEWFEAGLQEWDISRDEPYFGFEIPDAPGKYFYVWLDAPIGYLASFKNLCDGKGIDFDDWTRPDTDAGMYHFIGKDIMYFHGLFWPAMLRGSGFHTPDNIFVHGFLTVNGQKMSKSRGTFITARTYLQYLDPEYLRYYFAAKLGPGIEDIDLNFEDFVSRINADLEGKVVNIASRCAGFINKKSGGRLAGSLDNPALIETLSGAGETIAAAYERREYSRAMREIMNLADQVNQYIDEKKPWIIAKEEGRERELQAVCTTGLNGFRLLAGYLKPVLPGLAEKSEQFLNIAPLTWSQLSTPLLDHGIKPFKPLMTRVDPDRIDAMIEDSKEDLQSQAEREETPMNSMISGKSICVLRRSSRPDTWKARTSCCN